MRDLVFILLITAASISMVFGLSLVWNKVECDNYHEVTGKPVKFKIIGGCYVKSKSGWHQKGQVRGVDVNERLSK